MEKKENASKLISSLVALSLATTLGVPTIALADMTGDANAVTQQQAAGGEAADSEISLLEANETSIALQGGEANTLPEATEGVIKLTQNVVLNQKVTINTKVTLDLNGYEITASDRAFAVVDGGDLTVKGEGSIKATYSAIDIIGDTTPNHSSSKTAKATIENGNLSAREGAIGVYGAGAELIVNGGVISGTDNGAIMGNGTKNDNENDGGYKITINGGTITGNTTSEGYRNCGIYHPNSGDLIINGGTITGTTGAGVVVRSGNLMVTGGTISGKGQGGDNLKMGDAVPTYCGGIEVGYSVKYPGGMGDISITGGTISSENSDALKVIGTQTNGSDIEVTGGTFSDFSALDYTIGDSNIVIRPAENVILSKSAVLSKGETVTVDLGEGHTISKDSMPFKITHGKLSLVGKGTVYESENDKYGAVVLKGSTNSSDSDYSELTVGEGVTLRGWSGIFIDQNAKSAYGVKVTLNGKAMNPGEEGHAAAGYGIYLNGCITDKVNCPEITVGKTAEVTSKGTGIYAAGYGKWNLSGNVSGADAAIEIRSGEMNISDGEYTASATQFSCDANGNGTTTVGAALAIAQHTTKKDIAVTINGGHFKGVKALSESNPQSNDPKPQVSLVISDGRYDGEISVQDVANFITGGTFSSELDAGYIADGYEAAANGSNYVVQRIASIDPAPNPTPTTETTTTTNPDGTTTTTVTDKKTGESTSTTEGANGTTVVEKTDASGNTTTKVTVPEGAVTNAGAPVEIPAAVEVTKGKEVSISAPAGTIVAIPAAADAGNVAVIVHADGTETVIPMSLVEGGKAIVKLDGDETIKIVDNAKDFSDVPAEHWAADDIDFASSHEIFKGIGNGDTYEPETALTRNMMMTVLARTDGADTSDSDPWYAKGQQWAVDNGVSNGLWGEDSITREQLVTMLFNYANKSGIDTSARADLSGMKNADAVSDWALEAVQWAVAEGILKGVDNTDLAPQGLATRAQAAAFMQRYVKTALL